MWKFILGLATGYLTMTERGQEIADKMLKSGKKEVERYLKKEGVIEDEQPKDTGPSEPSEPVVEPEKQPSTSKTVDE